MSSLDMDATDLTTCDREPIHLLGAIQPFGFLIGFSSDWFVSRISENVQTFIGRSWQECLGAPAGDLLEQEALHTIRGRLQILRGEDSLERIFGLRLFKAPALFDVALHLSGDTVIMEAEPSVAEEAFSAGSLVKSMVSRLQQTRSMETFFRDAARQLRMLIDFDRVMIYRFASDGTGEVVAEATKAGIDSYLGLRYPSTDIPKQARALYTRNLLRIIADTEAEPVPVLPARDPLGRPLDLSLSILRSVSPIHVEYMRNMGTRSSMSVSILQNGQLWGLMSCHNIEPKHVNFEKRTAAELYGQMFSLLLESREREQQQIQDVRVRQAHNRLMISMAADEQPFESISKLADDIRESVDCDGMGLWINGEARLHGITPTREEFIGLVRFLNRAAASQVYATHNLGSVYEPAKDFSDRVAGLLAIPISRSPRDYMVFFRKELARTVVWAGRPEKVITRGPEGERLSPRKSFDAWREVVRDQSAPWSDEDIRSAEMLRISLLEIVLRLTDAAERERRSTQERQELLIAELNHRVRNILGLIRGLVSQSRGSENVADFVSVFGSRIQALARAHDQITTDNWKSAPLRTLIQAEAEAYLAGKADRMLLSGPGILLHPQAFTTLALVVHELMTNSAKYGALCDRRGHVKVSWHLDEMEDLVIEWQEQNGPPVQPPSRRGFGTTIIERSVPYDLKGQAEVHFELSGLRARYVIPAFYVEKGADLPVTEAPRPEERTRPVLGGEAMVVEDNIIIAMDADDMLRGLGADDVVMAASVRDAFALLDTQVPAFSLLDFNLGMENSLPVAERLNALNVPFAFASGYGMTVQLPPALEGVPIISKPYTSDSLRHAIQQALARIQNRMEAEVPEPDLRKSDGMKS